VATVSSRGERRYSPAHSGLDQTNIAAHNLNAGEQVIVLCRAQKHPSKRAFWGSSQCRPAQATRSHMRLGRMSTRAVLGLRHKADDSGADPQCERDIGGRVPPPNTAPHVRGPDRSASIAAVSRVRGANSLALRSGARPKGGAFKKRFPAGPDYAVYMNHELCGQVGQWIIITILVALIMVSESYSPFLRPGGPVHSGSPFRYRSSATSRAVR